MFSYFIQSARIMRFIIFIYGTQILIPAISDHKLVKSFETRHPNTIPLKLIPRTAARRLVKRFTQRFRKCAYIQLRCNFKTI